MDLTCSICGDPLNKLFSHKLGCGHEFHYECLQKSFICMKNNNCPYCRSGNNLLPLVNGLKKIKAVIDKPKDGIFILSDKSEKELIEDYGGQSWIVPLGIILSGIGLSLILKSAGVF